MDKGENLIEISLQKIYTPLWLFNNVIKTLNQKGAYSSLTFFIFVPYYIKKEGNMQEFTPSLMLCEIALNNEGVIWQTYYTI